VGTGVGQVGNNNQDSTFHLLAIKENIILTFLASLTLLYRLSALPECLNLLNEPER
jgi:hypothetical protein